MRTILILPLLIISSATLFCQGWAPVGNGNNLTGPTANVWMLHTNPLQNELYIGGCFDFVNSSVSRHAGLWNSSGFSSLQSGMDQGSGIVVLCAENYNGNTYYGGRFQHANGILSPSIACWNGFAWDSVGSGANGMVTSLKEFDGQLYVGGGFDTICGIQAESIAKWDGATWTTVGSALLGDVVAMEEYNAALYAWTTVSCFVLVDNEWVDLEVVPNPPAIGLLVCHRGMAVYNGELYLGGVDSAGGANYNGIAKWNGLQWSNVGLGLASPANNSTVAVTAITVYSNELYVGGKFTSAGNVPVNNIAKWDGTSWSALAGGVNSYVIAMDTIAGSLVVGGLFWEADGIPVDRIAFWTNLTAVQDQMYQGTTFSYNSSEATLLISGTVPSESSLLITNSLGQQEEIFPLQEGMDSQSLRVDLTSGFYCFAIFSKQEAIISRKIVITK